jgi:hypothetical protein
MHKNIALLALLLLLPALTWGQSLGAAARDERERREKNKKQGVEAREFTEEEIFGEDEEPDGENADETDDAASTSVDDQDEASSDRPSIDMGTTPQESDERDEGQERERDETQWRARFQRAKQRIESAREQLEFLDGLNLTPGSRYIDAQGRTVIASLEHLRELVAAAQQEQSESEQALAKLQQDARRAGVPPGWTR